MAGFLYYVPNGTQKSANDVDALGLRYAFERPPTPAVVYANGPDNGSGVVLADERATPEVHIGVFPGRQRWRPIPDGKVWIGFNTDMPLPGPDDLKRADQLKGHLVRLSDGRDWLTPVARAVSDSGACYNALPAVPELLPDGTWGVGRTIDQYAPIWDVAERYWDAFCSANGAPESAEKQGITITFNDLLDSAVRVLAVNYRIGKMEAALLEILSGKSPHLILEALIDWPRMVELMQKKTLDPVAA